MRSQNYPKLIIALVVALAYAAGYCMSRSEPISAYAKEQPQSLEAQKSLEVQIGSANEQLVALKDQITAVKEVLAKHEEAIATIKTRTRWLSSNDTYSMIRGPLRILDDNSPNYINIEMGATGYIKAIDKDNEPKGIEIPNLK